MSNMVKVSKLPEKLPWNEGTVDQVFANESDYFVVNGTPQYGDLIRMRDNTGESFFVYTQTGILHEPTPPAPFWNALDFKRRFTTDEQVAIYTAAKTVVLVQVFIALLDTAAACGVMIHADDPDVIAGVTAYENAGLIASGRGAQILSAP